MDKFLRIKDKKYEGNFSSEPYDFGFELDDFQKHAITAIQNNENVLVTAHTGSGKTVPAIYGIAHSLQKNRKIIYTSPIKSLSNQKLFELKQKFPDVGILTGDIKFNPDAQCVIMTTEILRNILYQKESQHIDISEVDKIVFDEVHYINDPDRGRVWEECIILCPKEITLIMLSATIDKAENFASWIGNIQQKVTNLIPTTKRVVPLEHFIYQPNTSSSNFLKKIVSSDGVFHNYNEIKSEYEVISSFKIINSFVEYLKIHNLVPALFFIFSRKECEKLAKALQISLVSVEEAGEIDKIFNYELRHHKKTYEKSPQYITLHKLLLKGIAYHHSGLIPILKEVIEILFAKGLIKVLFATETFAVGVNMPTKTVIFPKLTKYSNNNFRYLRTDEYLQMAGRAGRRGLDDFGTVIVLPNDELMELSTLKKMMTGKSPCINSKFKLNYQFLLKIMNNSEHDLTKFMDKTLFSLDNLEQIERHNGEKKLVEDKCIHGINPGDYKVIEEYYSKKNKLGNLRGNTRKRESIKLEKTKREIRNFESINTKYQHFLKKKEDIKKLDQSIDYLKTFVNLDVEKMVKYLCDNKYIDKESKQVLSKGIMASEISECNEIMLTEMITNDFFLELEPAEIVGILAVFIEEKSNDVTMIKQLNISSKMKDTLEKINFIAQDFGDYEYNSYIEIGTDWNLYLSFIGPAYDWARGKSIYEIYSMYSNVYEGTFIRNILRINNIIENIKNIAEMINNSDLLKKLENVEPLLVRDQVTTESLYITK
jgi:superfamily II RNA helicase